ncbi:unnamed protein product [Nippostrongylus brasiliensis]|uniref:Agglutinin domain-containing protein n=1 Tax=Nippostrongylus brasiliensis TaxID=27835 RepID=A0A0N4XFR2_NIPBR|nr:unnamed protein product [Nippostrongylus brasiliensis]
MPYMDITSQFVRHITFVIYNKYNRINRLSKTVLTSLSEHEPEAYSYVEADFDNRTEEVGAFLWVERSSKICLTDNDPITTWMFSSHYSDLHRGNCVALVDNRAPAYMTLLVERRAENGQYFLHK